MYKSPSSTGSWEPRKLHSVSLWGGLVQAGRDILTSGFQWVLSCVQHSLSLW